MHPTHLTLKEKGKGPETEREWATVSHLQGVSHSQSPLGSEPQLPPAEILPVLAPQASVLTGWGK